MDSEYSGALNNLYCEVCREEVPNVFEAYKHVCFNDVDGKHLFIEGNVIRKKEFALLSQNSLGNETLEYLDEDKELFNKESGFMTATNLPFKYQRFVSTNQVHKVVLENANDEDLNPNREVLKKKKSVCNLNVGTKSTAKKQGHRVQDRRQSTDEESSQDIEVDENGVAYSNEKNLISMIEMVKENPCLWNYVLPIADRNPYIITSTWAKISSHFPGWTPQMIRSQYSNLKGIFIRRNMPGHSGSANTKKKSWPYDKYFEFLKDTVSPGRTISNISPPIPKKVPSKEKISEDGSMMEELGYEMNSDKEAVPEKKRKSTDNVERILLERICNKETRNSRTLPNQWDQWGLWLSKELQDFSDPTDRIEIQAYITSYIAQRKRELRGNLAEDV